MVNPAWGSFQKPNQEVDRVEQVDEFEEELPGEMIDEAKPEAKKPQWGDFKTPTTYQGEPDPTEDESWFEYIARNSISYASRLAEQVAGRYGNTEKFAKDILSNIPSTGGVLGWAISELVGPEKWERMVRGSPGQEQMFPTSSQLKEASEKLSGGYTKAKTKGESKFQEFIEDVGSVIQGRTPQALGRRSQTLKNGINKLLIPAAANVTKQTVEGLGFGEDKANMAKMAVWIPMSLASNVNAKRYASDLMNQGRNGISPQVHGNVARFTQRLDALERSPQMLSSDPRTMLARQQITAIRNDLVNGQTNSQSFFNRYDGVNAAKRNRDMFSLQRRDQEFARARIDEVRNLVGDEIRDFAQHNPQAIQAWQNGVVAWSSIHTSQALTNYVESLAKGPYAKILAGPAAGLFGVGPIVGSKMAPHITVGASAVVPAAYKSGQVLYRMFDNQTLNNYYWRSIGAASNENLPVFLNNYEKLNKALTSEDKKEKAKKNKNHKS